MKQLYIFVFLFIGGLFSANAADTIVLKDGNMIDAKVMEINPTEIKYKRADNLNGPMIIILKNSVLSIRYENGIVEVINASPPAGQGSTQTGNAQTGGTVSSIGQQLGVPTSLQAILNALPAIPIAGNNLKFQFSGDNWTAMLNGENFWAGTIEIEDTDGGSILNLKQTHIWPGAVGKAAGRLVKKIPGAGAVGGALDTAGNIAGKAGAVEVSGPVIVLEYKAGPPAKLSYLRSSTAESAGLADTVPIVLADAQWRPFKWAAPASAGKNITVKFNIADEEIGGQIREVLTVEVKLGAGDGWKQGQVFLEDKTTLQQLREGSGVRFKVLGDGKKWILQIPTIEGRRDDCWYEAPIATKKGKVVQIDIPYSKLTPVVNGKMVPFINESITNLQLIKQSNTGTGPSTIKVFDFEIY
jgi:hypothetical protein